MIEYMLANNPMTVEDATKEIERYIDNPGQALSYKIGMLKILELRERAKRSSAPKFDIRDFHDVVLKNGAVPLPILESLVNDYIAAKKAAGLKDGSSPRGVVQLAGLRYSGRSASRRPACISAADRLPSRFVSILVNLSREAVSCSSAVIAPSLLLSMSRIFSAEDIRGVGARPLHLRVARPSRWR